MEWTDETIARLKALWQEGLSTAEIGRQIGITKNAVVGKAHRLSLPARPSPIRRQGAAKASAAKTTSDAGTSEEGKVAPQRVAKAGAPAQPEVDASPRIAKTTDIRAPDVVETGSAGVVVVTDAPVMVVEKVAKTESVVEASSHTEVAVVPGTIAHEEKPAPALRPKPVATSDDQRSTKTAPVNKPAASRSAFRSISSGLEPRRRGPSCCWPLGDPGTPEFHFCGATPLPGKPYCAEHAALAYVKLRDRRDNVA
ncbi:GcrA family cell cycle regulator [Acetobacter fallax]|uniref:GcrA cell cycle regulator n=1 Tax=Acetobacter fallax TaxID=1737473 RepID=A0ABX0K814_9PROT|nr:GcrA family cell cycle regulator [Acetobacter fallax]NHO32530.1 GcrA cell cycle regulator [Acetobacter fallax]NHO36125.1 GcrA cell cycle regulator [Acetobacter fallax]